VADCFIQAEEAAHSAEPCTASAVVRCQLHMVLVAERLPLLMDWVAQRISAVPRCTPQVVSLTDSVEGTDR
jgi:hypothetical protein